VPADGFSLKQKHAANNKTDINSVEFDGWYFRFTLYKTQQDVADKRYLCHSSVMNRTV
jgi:hypothetical protein